jgi:membrane-bound lytic murein transglycosylase D
MHTFALITLILSTLLLFNLSPALCRDVEGTGSTGGSVLPTAEDGDSVQSGDVEDELPDNPLSDQAAQTQALEEAASTSSDGASTLTKEENETFERLRNSLLASEKPEEFDIPVVVNDAVKRHIRCFQGTKRDVFARWLKRAKKYAPTITNILKENGLPEDLVYLAMIESGFNMKAYSSAKASGPWQFIHETGERYGLRVNYWVDERRDLEKSTVAAGRYLKDLFGRFGCWYLAAAGYNAGENRIERAIEKHDTKDFWSLRERRVLPKETREYVPQLIAAALIAKDPDKYGFDDVESPPVYALSKIRVPGGVTLRRIAHALSLETAELRSLNPELLRGITPPDRNEYQINLPGTADLDFATRRLEASLNEGRQVVSVVKHYVKKRDSLKGILSRYSVSHSDLRLVNGEGRDVRVKKGQTLYIPRFASVKDGETSAFSRKEMSAGAGNQGHEKMASYLPGNEDDPATLEKSKGPKKRLPSRLAKPVLANYAAKGTSRVVVYRVKRGDSLASIAKQHGVNLEELRRLNRKTGRTLKPGMLLNIK